MTCILGVVDKDTGDVYIGGDSSAVAEYDMLTIATPKVFRVGPFLFGFAGHFRFGQVIQHAFDPPKYKGGDLAAYMSRDVMEGMREVLDDAGFLRSIEGRDRAGLGMIGYEGRLFVIQDEFEVLEMVDNVAAIGCGYPYALGAWQGIQSLNPDATMEWRVRKSLEISEYYSGGVRAPFHILRLEGPNGTKQGGEGNPQRNRGAKAKPPRKASKKRS